MDSGEGGEQLSLSELAWLVGREPMGAMVGRAQYTVGRWIRGETPLPLDVLYLWWVRWPSLDLGGVVADLGRRRKASGRLSWPRARKPSRRHQGAEGASGEQVASERVPCELGAPLVRS